MTNNSNIAQRISANDAKTLIDKGNSQIIDIRDPMSFQSARISQSAHIDNNNIGQFMSTADPQAPLIICCYHGNASQSAAHYFCEQGFKEVYSLDGGFEQWKVMYPENCES